MKKLLPALLILAVSSCTGEDVFDGTSYGEALVLTETMELATLLASPEDYVGQRVQVEGTVREVCKSNGCWMEIAIDQEAPTIQVKVEDDVIKFPISVRGKRALVEGIVQEFDLTPAQAEAAARHRANDQGIEYDPSDVTEADTRVFRIQGLGAVIAD